MSLLYVHNVHSNSMSTKKTAPHVHDTEYRVDKPYQYKLHFALLKTILFLKEEQNKKLFSTPTNF